VICVSCEDCEGCQGCEGNEGCGCADLGVEGVEAEVTEVPREVMEGDRHHPEVRRHCLRYRLFGQVQGFTQALFSTRVLQECCKGVTRVLRECESVQEYKSVTRVLQEDYRSVTRVLQ
jgi:hypothetical protein